MERNLIILQGKKRLFYERIIAAICFALIIYVSYVFFVNTSMVYSEKYIKSLASYLKLVIFCTGLGVYFSYQKHHHFDLKNNKYRAYYTIGVFGIGKWKKLKPLSYTSINYHSKIEMFEVSIWDASNNRYKVSYSESKNDAKETAKLLSEKLNIQFYDKDKFRNTLSRG